MSGNDVGAVEHADPNPQLERFAGRYIVDRYGDDADVLELLAMILAPARS